MNQGKVLVIYYSLSGNTKLMAEEIKSYVGADLLSIEPVNNKMKPKGVMKYVWGGSQVKMGKKPELKPYNVDLAMYDTIIIGTPIWASRLVPALYSFLDQEEIKGKNIAMYCCHAGGGNGKAFMKIKEQLPGNTFIGDIELRDPQSKGIDQAKADLKIWLEAIGLSHH